MIQSVDGPYQDTVDDSVDMQDWPQDDARLVGIIQSNPSSNEAHQAFQVLHDRYKNIIFVVIYKNLKNVHDTEEVMQHVFIRAFRFINQLKDPLLFAHWLKRIAKNLTINFVVRNRKHFFDEFYDKSVAREDSFGNVEAHVFQLRLENITLVRDVLLTLRRMDREVIEMFYFQEKTIKEIAGILDCPEGTVKRRLFTARERLRAAIEERQPDFDRHND